MVFRYDIMNFQMLTNGSYDYVQVGEWNNGTLILDKEMQFTHDNIESVCAKPCQPGYYRVRHKPFDDQTYTGHLTLIYD